MTFPWAHLSLFAGVIAALYPVMFIVSRQPVTLRPVRLGFILVIVAGLRIVSAASSDGSQTGHLQTAVALLVLACGLLLLKRMWIFHTDAARLLEAVRDACRRLRLSFEESAPGEFILTDSNRQVRRLRILPISNWIGLIWLPKSSGTGRVELLRSWLSKQYPGPVPMVHIILKEKHP